MKKITKGMLKKEYPLADEDFLLAMVEGKVYMANYILKKKYDIIYEFELVYMPIIKNIFIKYFNNKKRDYFDTEDMSMVKTWNKQVTTVVKKFGRWTEKVYVTSVAEAYNYKRLYNLWMLDTIYGADEDNYEKPKIIGEADEDITGIIDPGFSKEKLNSIINNKLYGSTFSEKVANSIDVSVKEFGTSINTNLGVGKEYNAYLKDLERTMKKKLSKRIGNALSMGLEEVEDISDYDIFSANIRWGQYQRVEILDNKTCLVCASLDKMVYKEAVGRIHPNCRGIDVPIIDKTNEEKQSAKKMATKKSRKESFNNWFEGLNETDKKRLLGKNKYELYKTERLEVHDLVKQSRILGFKEIKQINQMRLIPNVKNNYTVVKKTIENEARKLPKSSIAKITKLDELSAYSRFVNKKESLYKNMSSNAIKKANIHRNTLNAEINRERKLIRIKEKELTMNKLTKGTKKVVKATKK